MGWRQGQFQGKTAVVWVTCADLLPQGWPLHLRDAVGSQEEGGGNTPPLLTPPSLTGCIHSLRLSHTFTPQATRVPATGEALPQCLGLREIRNSHLEKVTTSG